MSTQRVAVVTGTTNIHGIGRSIATAFIQRGYKVLGVDITTPVKDTPPADYYHVVADISRPDSGVTIRKACLDAFKCNEIDVLVNNAAIVDIAMPETYDERVQQFQTVLATNLLGPYMLSEALIPAIKPGGSIIHISSTRALQSEPHTEAYSASKAGLLGLTHAQSISLALQKIRVNAILPGWIDTGSTGDIRPEDHEWHPAGRVGKPEDVANMCVFFAISVVVQQCHHILHLFLFLVQRWKPCKPSKNNSFKIQLSEQAAFITGQQFVVDGGVTRKMVYPE